jgi:aspartate/glutamate racemase
MRKHKLYENIFAQYGINAVSFPNQEMISKGIEVVKQNGNCTKIAESIVNTINTIASKIDSILFGCTEIGLLMKSIEHPYKAFVDSNQALADFCWEFATNNLMVVDRRIRLFV